MHSNYKVMVILVIFGNPKQLLQVYLKKKGKINKRSHFFLLLILRRSAIEQISYIFSIPKFQKCYFLLQQNLSVMRTYLLSCILNTPNVFKMANQCRFIFSSFLENGEFILENYFEIHSREFSRNQFSRSITTCQVYILHHKCDEKISKDARHCVSNFIEEYNSCCTFASCGKFMYTRVPSELVDYI